jgi:tRNA1Val (adenine37-N6)-methyltransferase
MDFYQYPKGYRYNSDSLVLYDFISHLHLKGNVLDVGSGCGILGLLLKRDFPKINLTQIEVQKLHYELNLKNIQTNGLEVEILHKNFLHVDFSKKFDFIVSNPPFYDMGSKKSENETLHISRHAENLPLEQFIAKVSSNLTPQGSFIFCYDAKALPKIISYLFSYKFTINQMRFIHAKENKNSHLIVVYAKKSSKSLLKVLPPLILHDEKGNFTQEIQSIYKKADTMSYSWQI